MLVRRIVPCLDIKEGRVVKGVRFVQLIDAGDPVELARRYENEGADELVFLDITATVEGRKATLAVVRAVAAELTLIDEAARRFGAQCVVVAIDVRTVDGHFEVVVDGGRTPTGRDAIEWAQEAERRGAGELLVTSIDRDGTKEGFDLPLLRAMREAVDLPIIASGGAGELAHFVDVFEQAGSDAALAATLFHYGELAIVDVKRELAAHDIPVRLEAVAV